MNIYLYIISFFAGVMTFFTSCAFVLVPPFLGLVSPIDAINDRDVRLGVLKNTIFYILGFSLVFTFLGVAAGAMGRILGAQEVVGKIGGVVLILMGLFIAGFFRFRFLTKNISFRIPEKMLERNKLNSFLLGGVFAFAWSPCTGPFLGSILMLAGYSSTVVKGAILLLMFSFGIAMPFLFMGLFWGQIYRSFGSFKLIRLMSIFSGVFLVVIGILLVTGNFYSFFSRIESFLN